jgi:hypothetical protein
VTLEGAPFRAERRKTLVRRPARAVRGPTCARRRAAHVFRPLALRRNPSCRSGPGSGWRSASDQKSQSRHVLTADMRRSHSPCVGAGMNLTIRMRASASVPISPGGGPRRESPLGDGIRTAGLHRRRGQGTFRGRSSRRLRPPTSSSSPARTSIALFEPRPSKRGSGFDASRAWRMT